MSPVTSLYDADFYAWTQQQAALLREGKVHELDLANLAEEIESLGKRDRRELGSRLEILVMHLLKWCYQPKRRQRGHSWQRTIWTQRGRIMRLLDQSPGLQPVLPALLRDDYARTRRQTLKETGLPETMLPRQCPWTIEQVLDEDFWPEEQAPEPQTTGDPPPQSQGRTRRIRFNLKDVKQPPEGTT